jgi:heptaprenyl diphosphate synthase
MVEQSLIKGARSRNSIIEEILMRLVKAGGKRLRPALVLICGQYGGADIDRLVPLATSVEMIHMATLIHDDVIDDADFRRGIETTHKKWDTGTAIFAGDYLLSKAFGIITDNTVFDNATHAAKAFKLICEGEIEQYYSRNKAGVGVRKYLARIRYKTAVLFGLSCYLGASTTNISHSEMLALRSYGINLGMAFQIKDDLLDLQPSTGQLGKPVGNDLRQGIYTLPVIYALKDKRFGGRLGKLLDSDEPDQRVIQQATAIILESGAVQQARDMQNRYIAKANSSINRLKPGPNTQLMRDLLGYMVNRIN